ncbi:MAG: bis(5'-nucleosyl)-tetraphosphatase (symmetrical) YqeK [Treponema sp.]|nr:bis(5'-nucleosyl)-tetraphosphatase (symmetrical) YqeK [Candidatus Treponema caballi]
MEEEIEKMKKVVQKTVSQARYAHSLRTARTAEELCIRYELDGRTGYYCGVVHDMCKEMSDRQLISLARLDSDPVSDVEKGRPNLMHGRAAAVMLERDYGIDEPEILEAVKYHTFGKPGICDLAKVLYVSDKMEPGRQTVPADFWKTHENDSLNDLVIWVLEDNIRYMSEIGNDLSPWTEEFLFYLVKKD